MKSQKEHLVQETYDESNKDPFVNLDINSIKKQFGKKFDELLEIVNKQDPMGLLSMGAPENEYDLEVKTIIVQLFQTKNEKETLDLVYKEFQRWFDGASGKKSQYKKLAKEIEKWKNEQKDEIMTE